MKYSEIKQDLFKTSVEYALAHCVSEDALMDEGVSLEIARRFPNCTNFLREAELQLGDAYLISVNDNKDQFLFNLVTKGEGERESTYNVFATALHIMKQRALKNKIDKIAMPKIGAHTDVLKWDVCRSMLLKEFEDTDIELMVCC